MNHTEATEFFTKLGEAIATQDARMTSHCVYVVCEDGPRGRGRVQGAVFLTHEAADGYIVANGHNLSDPYVYVESGHENREWVDLRAACLAMYEASGGDRHLRRFTMPHPKAPACKLYSLPESAKPWACTANVGDVFENERCGRIERVA